MPREIKLKFVIDNKYITREYSITTDCGWCLGDEQILEDLEEDFAGDCNCINESCNHCECQLQFEDSKITAILRHTGRKDKNRKEVFEGDLLAEDNKGLHYWEVVWNKKIACFELLWTCKPFKNRARGNILGVKDYKKVGNKFENPSLLK